MCKERYYCWGCGLLLFFSSDEAATVLQQYKTVSESSILSEYTIASSLVKDRGCSRRRSHLPPPPPL